jgi:hypothetical protein
MNHTPQKPFHTFQHELDTFSTGFQQLFAFFNKSLVFFVFASKIRQSLITGEATKQTEFKGNFESMSLYRHKEACCHFAPPKNTFPSLKPSPPKNKPSQTRTACHFAPPTATCLTWAVKREDCLSLRAAERGLAWGKCYRRTKTKTYT